MAPDPKVRLAVAGPGWIASVHGLAVDHVPGLAITAVASRDPDRAAEVARRTGASPVGYQDLPAGADGVLVCTPPARHAADTLAAVRAGAGVLVEKPLCTTLAEADEMVAAEEAGAQIAYAENLAHAPAVERALAMAEELGAIEHIEVRALQGRPSWGDFLTEGWGGGVLFDLGAHPLAIALLLARPARPVEVRAELSGALDHPVDEHARVEVAFDTGLVAHVTASWAHPGTPVWDAQVSSADGVVRLELLPEVVLERNGAAVNLPGAPAGVPPQLEEMGYLRQMESFALDLVHDRRPTFGAGFGRQVLDLTCAAYASAGRGGAWFELPFDGPRDRTPFSLWKGPDAPVG